MKYKNRLFSIAVYPLFLTLISTSVEGQMITGVWKGKINRKKVEVKIIQKGDSLTGTSYYYESAGMYRRYSIRGYFEPGTNNAVWWDDQLIEEKTTTFSSPGRIPYLSSADFNCPGSDEMYLNGKASEKSEPEKEKGPVDLEKTNASQFPDEWDFIIDNYTAGANDPTLIDSVGSIATQLKKDVLEDELPTAPLVLRRPSETIVKTEPGVVPAVQQTLHQRTLTIDEKFITRERVFTKEIPLAGDSIELRFYDNAEIDGDSISLFLNDKLLFEHIKLTANPYIIKLPISELQSSNELIMVAENLGSIPPNTSYMLAIVEGQRHEAYLASSEKSSAMIRLVKK